MIIAIDGYEANVEHRVGIGEYSFQMLHHLHKLLSETDGHTYHTVRVYLPEKPRFDMPKPTRWWRYQVRFPKRLWTLVGLPMALNLDRPRADIVFSPTHYVPRYVTIPRVMSIMDMSFLEYPNLFKPKDLHQLVHWTRYSALHAAKIFTISEFSKNAIIRAYGVSADRVVVTYPGLPMKKIEATKNQASEIFQKYQLSRHYIVSVGTLQPRKNYIRLIEAFSIFLDKNRQKFGKIDLVIIGKRGWLYDEILAAPGKYGVADSVKFLDFIPDRELSLFYQKALCFALPSLYEGFGLPVLEAMANRCPVVVSNVSSLPEIAGKAGIYVDPLNTQSITDGLLAAVRERNLIQGRRRITLGLERVRYFTWEKAAQDALSCFEEVARRKDSTV